MKLRKRIFSLFIALIIIMTMLPEGFTGMTVTASAQTVEVQTDTENVEELDYILGRPLTDEELAEKQRLTEEYSKYLVPQSEESPFATTTSSQIYKYSSSTYTSVNLPSEYNLADSNKVTPPKNQNPYGICWSFATIASYESSLLMQGLAENPDLSELYLAYVSNHNYTDPLGNMEDKIYDPSKDYLNAGGNMEMTTLKMMSGLGLADEADYPLSDAENARPSMQGYTVNSIIAGAGPYYTSNVYLEKMSNINAIKSNIMTYGAGAFSMHFSDTVFNENTAALYATSGVVNHAVSVVGWDDSYSKANFTVQPNNDGAWLCKNSWSGGWGDGGYFWISYDDAVTKQNTAFFFVASLSPGYENTYQYDGGNGVAIATMKNVSVETANMFGISTDKGKESIVAVSAMIGDGDCTIKIYKTDSFAASPADIVKQEPIMTKTVSNLGLGYHTIKLDKTIGVLDGDNLFVVVDTGTYEDDDVIFIEGDPADSLEYESYVSYDGNWFTNKEYKLNNNCIKLHTTTGTFDNPITKIELSTDSLSLKLGATETLTTQLTYTYPDEEKDDGIDWTSDNVAIANVDQKGVVTARSVGTTTITARSKSGKVFASCAVTVTLKKPAESIEADADEAPVKTGETVTVGLTVLPEDTDDYVTWKSDNAGIADVYTRTNKEVVIRGYGEGETTLTGTTVSGKTVTIKVTVEKSESDITAEDISKFENVYTFAKPPKILDYDLTYYFTIVDVPAIAKLNPVSVAYSATSQNLTLTPMGEQGVTGCMIQIKDVNSSKNKGEKIKITATASYLDKKGKVKTKKITKSVTTQVMVQSIDAGVSVLVGSEKKEKVTLKLTFNDGFPEQPSNTKVKYLITDATGAVDKAGKKVVSVNGKGEVTFKGPGQTYITICAVDSYDKTTKTYDVSTTIPVVCTPVTSLSFTETELQSAPEKEIDLSKLLVINPDDAFNKENLKFKWAVSDKSLGSVSNKGLLKLKKEVAGTLTVTVTCTDGVAKGETLPTGEITIVIQ